MLYPLSYEGACRRRASSDRAVSVSRLSGRTGIDAASSAKLSVVRAADRDGEISGVRTRLRDAIGQGRHRGVSFRVSGSGARAGAPLYREAGAQVAIFVAERTKVARSMAAK